MQDLPKCQQHHRSITGIARMIPCIEKKCHHLDTNQPISRFKDYQLQKQPHKLIYLSNAHMHMALFTYNFC